MRKAIIRESAHPPLVIAILAANVPYQHTQKRVHIEPILKLVHIGLWVNKSIMGLGLPVDALENAGLAYNCRRRQQSFAAHDRLPRRVNGWTDEGALNYKETLNTRSVVSGDMRLQIVDLIDKDSTRRATEKLCR